jgi:putative nucleotidyltransferase with HDIG domain
MSYLLCLAYLVFLGKEIFESFKATTLFLSIIVLTVLISKAVAVWPGSSFYLMPTSLAPLLFVLLLRPRFGFLSAVLMSVFAALLSDFNPEVILATLFSGFAATFAGIRVRKRIEFLRIGLVIGAVHFLVLFAARIFHEYPADESFQISVLGFANGFLISTPICFIMLSLFEWIFNLATDITLLELSDLNHPLLKRMIVEAPGTYHHSLVVSTLAEAACEAIGANSLLARVGCYFHDIGKIARAEFFTENMKNQNQSKHLKLTPTMSCLIIMNHVKEGVDLGRKYKLKARILQFIPEHQGTGVIYYFYRKALDHAKPNEKINPDDFRYPGPRPQSKETAVALLADSTEAASRSLKEPSPESIRQLVRKIINDKFIDGQLDECDLTLRDLHKIQESFVRNLMAIFHTRVVYPAVEVGGNRPDLFAEGEFSKYRVEDFKKPH